MLSRFAACAALALLSACGGTTPPPKPKHVVLIVVDTLRADHLTPYGYARNTAPHLAEFAKEAVVFERAVSQAAWTSSSMVSMMTSGYLGEEMVKIPSARTTLAEVFKKAGWSTAAFVFNDVLNVDCGFHRGFDVYDYQEPPYGPDTKIAEWFAAQKDHPTFTWIHLNEAHDPYGSFDDKWPAGAPTEFVGRSDSIAPEHRAWLEQYAKRKELGDSSAALEHIERHIGAYDDDVAWSDARIQRIFDAIRAAGLWDQSAIVVAADHGEGLWTREFYMTGTRLKAMLEGERPSLVNSLHSTHGSQVSFELVHVPLIVKAPGLPRGKRSAAVVENVDIAPTLFELCDLPVPRDVQGKSLLSLASATGSTSAKAGFSHTRFVSSLIAQDGMQLIHPTENGVCAFGLSDELYDLRADPSGRNNLAAQKPDVVGRMTAEIKKRMAEGLRADVGTLSAATMGSLNALGYLDSGVVEAVRQEFRGKPTPELIKLFEEQGANCLTRLEMLHMLAERELTDKEREELRAHLKRESMTAIRPELAKLLAN